MVETICEVVIEAVEKIFETAIDVAFQAVIESAFTTTFWVEHESEVFGANMDVFNPIESNPPPGNDRTPPRDNSCDPFEDPFGGVNPFRTPDAGDPFTLSTSPFKTPIAGDPFTLPTTFVQQDSENTSAQQDRDLQDLYEQVSKDLFQMETNELRDLLQRADLDLDEDFDIEL